MARAASSTRDARASDPDSDATERDDAVAPEAVGRRHEVLGIVAAAATILTSLSLLSYDQRGGENWIGPFGEMAAGACAALLGIGAWLVPGELALLTIRLFRRTIRPQPLARVLTIMVTSVAGCALLHVVLEGETFFGGQSPGGLLGELGAELLRSGVSTTGTVIVASTVLLVAAVLRTSFSLVATIASVGRWIGRVGRAVAAFFVGGARSIRARIDAAMERARQEREARAAAEAPTITLPSDRPTKRGRGKSRDAAAVVEPPTDGEEDVVDDPVEAAGDDDDAPNDAVVDDHEEPEHDVLDAVDTLGADDEPAPSRSSRPPSTGTRSAAKKGASRGPVIVSRDEAQRAREAEANAAELAASLRSREATTPATPFVLPPTTMLDPPPPEVITVDRDALLRNAQRLEATLADYGVTGKVDEIHPGPVVTMYELQPAAGTKLSRIASLSDDLAMSLEAQKVRIVAPIPGKNRVGFELPNKHRQMVALRSILEDPRWAPFANAAMPMALGKDIAGEPFYCDLAKMPHLLVAGATGSGKSVGLNVMLASLLFRKTPEQVRLLMIDPKVVELQVFDGIPHMLLPVVTDMKKAALALRWAVDEMERRYQLFADAGAKNIETYNRRVERVHAGEITAASLKKAPQPGKAHDSSAGDETAPVRLPYVLVVVDEFADLMMVAAKDVEAAIARLAQKARASGIHVILATQRPSVDVITGMIKANFPSRIAFKVAQREDSKTILGRNGAEQLLGNGDMLILPPGSSEPKRIHSAFISEEELKELCDHVRAQGKPVYDERILQPRDDDGSGAEGTSADGGAGSGDDLYDRAVALVAEARACSISHLQRQLGLGYNRAAKLVERMEKDGVVGPPSAKAGGRRDVLISAL